MSLTFDLSLHPFPCSPVNLVSPTRFRFVYAFIFGAISSTLVGLVLSSRGVIYIEVNTHYLDIFVNTSKFSVDGRILPCIQRLHHSLTSFSFLFLSFLPLSFLFPSPPFSLLSHLPLPPVVNPALIILVYLFLYFPLFACVDTPFPLIGHIIGLLYTCILWVVASSASHPHSVWYKLLEKPRNKSLLPDNWI